MFFFQANVIITTLYENSTELDDLDEVGLLDKMRNKKLNLLFGEAVITFFIFSPIHTHARTQRITHYHHVCVTDNRFV